MLYRSTVTFYEFARCAGAHRRGSLAVPSHRRGPPAQGAEWVGCCCGFCYRAVSILAAAAAAAAAATHREGNRTAPLLGSATPRLQPHVERCGRWASARLGQAEWRWPRDGAVFDGRWQDATGGAVIDATIVATGEDFIVAEPAAFETVAAAAAAAVPIAVRYGMADKPCEMLQCASLQ